MAIMDARLEFSDNQATSTAVGSTYNSLVVDLGASNANVGNGNPIWYHFKVTQAPVGTSPNTATLTVKIQHANTNNTSSYSDLVIVHQAAIAASYTLGKEFAGVIPGGTVKRYLRAKYTVAATTLSTAAKFDAWLDLSS